MKPVGVFSEKINYHNPTITIYIKNLSSTSHRERRLTLHYFHQSVISIHTKQSENSQCSQSLVLLCLHGSTAVQNMSFYTFLYLEYWLQGKNCKFHSTFFYRLIISSNCIYSLYLSSTKRLLSLSLNPNFSFYKTSSTLLN